MSNDVKKNNITFYQNGNTNPENIVMSISKNGLWANPDLPATEAADLVLKALDNAIKLMVEKAIEEERKACLKICEEQANTNYWEGADVCAETIKQRWDKK